MARKSPPGEIEPLRRMCREGRLFDVQEWVRQGQPVTPKVPPPKNARNSPLSIAITRGFHSLVQVLLEAGVPIEEGNYHALYHAVDLRRRDLVELLIQYGVDVHDVSMQDVIATWDRGMIDLFLANGANLFDDKPVAWGLANKIRITLGLLKQYSAKHPELLEQANIALRYHASQGHAKWVALCLWAGADPWSRGPDEAPDWDAPVYDYGDDEEDYEPLHRNAVELAVSGGRLDVLRQKKFLTPPDPKRPETMELLDNIWFWRNPNVIKLLLKRGHSPRLYSGRCSSLLTWLLLTLSTDWLGCRYSWHSPHERDIDTFRAREVMEMIGLLLADGARWLPAGKDEVKRIRQSLLKMAPKYTFNFIQLVHEHRAARRRDIVELTRTPTMVKLIKRQCRKMAALTDELPEELSLDDK